MSIVILREKSPKFRLEAQNPHFLFWCVGKNQLLEDYLPTVCLSKEKKKTGEQKAGKKKGKKESELQNRGTRETEREEVESVRSHVAPLETDARWILASTSPPRGYTSLIETD